MQKCSYQTKRIEQNSKIICSYDMLRACTFRTGRKSLRAHYAHA